MFGKKAKHKKTSTDPVQPPTPAAEPPKGKRRKAPKTLISDPTKTVESAAMDVDAGYTKPPRKRNMLGKLVD